MFDFIIEVVGVISAVVCGASFVASVTATPKDDELIGKLYKIIEVLALNVGRAKMLPPNKD
jgi:hypothetical protein|tara:strand:- start:1078 stop:1260 length:183 start_codon:yes stop_codon:yes gene_type:complete